ncbi:MAG TPA: hypothetical protein VF173_16420 [Thermoanaerobaculia bacterium]|nr:hypothetical protein [Thermoanaerobaculia bacterium]
MSPLHFRRGLTALALLTLLFASPVLAQPRPVRTAHAVVSAPQLSLLDVFVNALSSLFSSSRSAGTATTATTTTGTGTSPSDGSGSGIRIDPDGRSVPPPTTPTTPSAGQG